MAGHVVHVADYPGDFTQACARCGELLVDLTEELAMESTHRFPDFYAPKVNVAVTPGGSSWITSDPVTCDELLPF